MTNDDQLYQLAVDVGTGLRARDARLALAESCTGGWVAKLLTDVAGSSKWFERGYVTYSNLAKQQDLAVDAGLLAAHGAVSQEVVEQMARGALQASAADYSLAISGIAGPDGGTPSRPVGLVWFALGQSNGNSDGKLQSESYRFAGDREAVRRQAVAHALKMIASALA